LGEELLRPGDLHYKAYVGHPTMYGEMGTLQFHLLTLAGLDEGDRVWEIGCGSLRLGKLLIPFLKRGRYGCIEPSVWLVANALKFELGMDILKVKSPTFISTTNFTVPPHVPPKNGLPNIVVAQSIFSHSGPDLLREAASNLVNLPNSLLRSQETILLATFVISGRNSLGSVDSASASGWVYPECVRYEEDDMKTILFEGGGLHATYIPHPHRFQSWYVVGRDTDTVARTAKRIEKGIKKGVGLEQLTGRRAVKVEGGGDGRGIERRKQEKGGSGEQGEDL
jgi:hypothetical protein